MSKFGFDKALKNMERLKETLPPLLANQAQNFFVQSWRKQGWDDGGIQRWKPRQDKGPKSQGRAILVKSGKLRRAIGQSIREQSFERIKLVVALPYAFVHNEGYNGPRRAHSRAVFSRSSTTQFIGLQRKDGNRKLPKTPVYPKAGEQKVKAHNLNIPKRQFMGDSKTLRKQQEKLIEKELGKIWQV